MALTFERTFTQNISGLTGLIDNTTTYGGANQDRNEAAEYRLWASLNSSGTRLYNNPDQGDVLTELQYEVSTEESGWHQDIQIRIQLYDADQAYVPQVVNGQGVVTQYASIFYDPDTEKIYKARIASTGQSPSNSTYFTEIPVSQLYQHLSNTNIEVSIEDHYIDAQVNVKLTNEFAAKKCGCAFEELEYIMNLQARKIAADSEFANGNYSEGQIDIDFILSSVTV